MYTLTQSIHVIQPFATLLLQPSTYHEMIGTCAFPAGSVLQSSKVERTNKDSTGKQPLKWQWPCWWPWRCSGRGRAVDMVVAAAVVAVVVQWPLWWPWHCSGRGGGRGRYSSRGGAVSVLI